MPSLSDELEHDRVLCAWTNEEDAEEEEEEDEEDEEELDPSGSG